MRTTLTLDEDVAAKLKAKARHNGLSFREVVNEMLRRGLANASSTATRSEFKVKARHLGKLRPGLSVDSIAKLIEQVEGPLAR